MIIKSSNGRFVPPTGDVGQSADSADYDLGLCVTFTPTVLHHTSVINTASVTCKGSCDRTNCGTSTCRGTCDCG